MKKIVICILALVLVAGALVVCMNFGDAEHTTALTYAAGVLAKDTDMIKSAIIGESFTFSKDDFAKTLGVERVKDITITALPDASVGVLKLGEVPLAVGDTVSAKDIESMSFTMANDAIREASFSFSSENYMGGASIDCKLIALSEKNNAPTISDSIRLSVATQKNIGIYGTMTSYDPENDKLDYFIVSFPEKGTLEIMSELGDFKYTPNANYTGKDSFSYMVRDCYGNFSDIATVSIAVEKNAIDLQYIDMVDSPAYNSALVLASRSIMLGELSGDGMYFRPTEGVSRAEFVVMAMKAAGIQKIEGLTETYFDDNDEIPTDVRPYIATAQKLGFINGSFDGDGLVFRPNDKITRAECAVVVTNILALPKESAVYVSFTDIGDAPPWARESICAAYQHGLFDRISHESMTIGADGEMSREMSANTLCAIINYVERNSNQKI